MPFFFNSSVARPDRKNRIGGLRRGCQDKARDQAGEGRRKNGPDGIELATACHAEPVLEPAGATISISTFVTRRMVRLIRPPSGSKVDVPGKIRSTP